MNEPIAVAEAVPIPVAPIHKRIFGCKIKQRNNDECPEFFVFYGSAKDINKWAGVRRADEYKDGTQRVYRESRLKAVQKFLTSNPVNTVPNNILIAFSSDAVTFSSVDEQLKNSIAGEDLSNAFEDQINWGFLDFDYDPNGASHEKIALIIDGQHRLFGIAKLDEDVPVLCVAILKASTTEQAFQFIVINNKAVKVATNNVKGIIADVTQVEAALNARLLAAGVPYGKTSPELVQIDSSEDSPFKKLLDWSANESDNKIVPLTAIEQLITSYKKQFTKLEDDSDSLNQFLFAIWNAVKTQYSTLWGVKKSRIMTKVVLNALNDYFVERLKFLVEFDMVDIFEPNEVQAKIEELIKKIPEEFWTATWPILIQDNANTRTMIKNDVEQIGKNAKSGAEWYEHLRLFKPTSKDLAEEAGEDANNEIAE